MNLKNVNNLHKIAPMGKKLFRNNKVLQKVSIEKIQDCYDDLFS